MNSNEELVTIINKAGRCRLKDSYKIKMKNNTDIEDWKAPIVA